MARTTRPKASSAIANAPRAGTTRSRKLSGNDKEPTEGKGSKSPPVPANTSRKRGRQVPAPGYKEEAESDEEPTSKRSRNTKSATAATEKSSSAAKAKPSTKPKAKGTPKPDLEAGAKLAAALTDNPPSSSPSKSSKSNPYNLTPGTSPYPAYPHPTPEACQAINDALAAVHGKISAPKTISDPSLTTSGCGEVPSVLDALIRTRLSAATNNANSSRAFRGLVDRFGTLKSGVGKGSVDWEAVRRTDVKEVFECIKSGGLADVKSRDIKRILDLVYEENEASRAQGDKAAPPKGVLSLDTLHSLNSDDAFTKLLAYPGIGPKTASCVLLFCMQRPSFAVDTHVFRLTKWLGWMPSDSEIRRMKKEALRAAGETEEEAERDADAPVKDEAGAEITIKTEADTTPTKAASKSKSKAKANPKAKSKQRVHLPPPVTRNSTYSHLDIRIPDELKYPLHYLLIKHGKTCPSCSAKADRKVKEEWGGKPCPIREFKRGGGKKLVKGEEDVEDVKDEEEDGDDDSEDGEEQASDGEADYEETVHGMKVGAK